MKGFLRFDTAGERPSAQRTSPPSGVPQDYLHVLDLIAGSYFESTLRLALVFWRGWYAAVRPLSASPPLLPGHREFANDR